MISYELFITAQVIDGTIPDGKHSKFYKQLLPSRERRYCHATLQVPC